MGYLCLQTKVKWPAAESYIELGRYIEITADPVRSTTTQNRREQYLVHLLSVYELADEVVDLLYDKNMEAFLPMSKQKRPHITEIIKELAMQPTDNANISMDLAAIYPKTEDAMLVARYIILPGGYCPFNLVLLAAHKDEMLAKAKLLDAAASKPS